MKILTKKDIEYISLTALARSYNILDYSEALRRKLSKSVDDFDFSELSKIELHKYISDIVFKFHNGENSIKARLVKQFIKKNVTAAFEIKVNTSRVDFLTVNGYTKSFEIKTSHDNLSKLAKQTSDYERVFDYNYIVVDESHLKNALSIIPEHFGVMISLKNSLKEIKASTLNENLDPRMQLHLFTKRELKTHFNKITDVSTILKQNTAEQINLIFKDMLKARYRTKWDFLKTNINDINSIDYQFFFQHNIEPTVIYSGH